MMRRHSSFTVAAFSLAFALAAACGNDELFRESGLDVATGGSASAHSSGGTTADGGTTAGGGTTASGGSTADASSGGTAGGSSGSGGALADASDGASDAADGADAFPGPVVPDFKLVDENPNSPHYKQNVSPRDYLGQVSAWYFGHST